MLLTFKECLSKGPTRFGKLSDFRNKQVFKKTEEEPRLRRKIGKSEERKDQFDDKGLQPQSLFYHYNPSALVRKNTSLSTPTK